MKTKEYLNGGHFGIRCIAVCAFRSKKLENSVKVKEKILNKYTLVQLIVHHLSLSNSKTLMHVEMELTDTG